MGQSQDAVKSISLSGPSSVDYSRRLSDKILAAFTHAYASGELGIAELLRSALNEAEQARDQPNPPRQPDALSQAELWVGFIDARNAYKRTSHEAAADEAAVDAALERMKQAYKDWSLS